MVVSISTDKLFENVNDAKKYFPILKNAGIGAIDYGFYDVYTSSDIYSKKTSNDVFDLPHDEMLEYFKIIRDAAVENGIVVGQTHAPFPTQRVEKEDVSEINEYLYSVLLKCIEVTAFLGCKYIVIHPVFGRYSLTVSPKEEFENNVKFYSSLIPTLKKFGVVACLENMWVDYKGKIYAGACGDFDEVNRYIEVLNGMAGEELFGYCLDSGHATICSKDLGGAVRKLGSNIKVLHLHEVDGYHDNHTIPFVGVTDWARLFEALNEIGYNGTVNFEINLGSSAFPREVLPEVIALLGACGNYLAKTYIK